MSLLIKNARILQENKIINTNILIEGSVIKRISPSEKSADKVIDIKNKLVLPGLIDAHVHLREPGMTHKEDFLTGTCAAAAGGFTTVLDMPNTIPPTITPLNLKEKRILAEKSVVNYGFHFGATNDNLNEIIKVENIASVKAYMGSSTGDMVISRHALERLFMEHSGNIVIHAEDARCLEAHKNKYPQLAEFHHKIRNSSCAVKALSDALDIAKVTQRGFHIAHISTLEEAEMIANAKKSGMNVTCEVTPHHLFLSAEEAKTQKNFVKVNPPLREKRDMNALWTALANGQIDIIATDHAPHTIAEKEDDYESAPAGVPGMETMLPLLLDAFNKRRISLQEIIKLTSHNPARIFQIRNKGEIKEKYDADLVVVDTRLEKRVINDELITKCKWSPFNRWMLRGWPVMCLVNGNLVYDNGEIIKIKVEEVGYYNLLD